MTVSNQIATWRSAAITLAVMVALLLAVSIVQADGGPTEADCVAQEVSGAKSGIPGLNNPPDCAEEAESTPEATATPMTAENASGDEMEGDKGGCVSVKAVLELTGFAKVYINGEIVAQDDIVKSYETEDEVCGSVEAGVDADGSVEVK